MAPVKYSVVVPTYKEQGNVEALITRLFAATDKAGFEKGSVEIIFVDDNSNDGTEGKVQALAKAGHQCSIIVRTKERGLSSAVIAGLKAAKGEFLLVMDADLQHPPESVPAMLRALSKPNVQFVLGTRYGAGVAVDKDWPLHRRIISWGARLLARPLTPLSDPMSGFFGIQRDVFQRCERKVNAIGYKIALELFVKAGIRKYEEVPFSFASRTVGESKLTGKVIVHYLKHLRALYWYAYGVFSIIVPAVLILAALYVLAKVAGLM